MQKFSFRSVVGFGCWLVFLLVASPAWTTAQPAAQLPAANVDRVTTPILTSIIDYDAEEKVVTIRTEFEFDTEGRRVANKVLDAQEQLLATERFSYDRQGRLAGREYRDNQDRLDWKWTKFEYLDSGAPSRHDIVDGDGKRIGHYVWHYQDGLLSRRERFDAKGRLRFYHAEIERDPGGHDLQWSTFAPAGEKTGAKVWKYRDR